MTGEYIGSERKQCQASILSWFTKQEGWDYDENNPSGIFFGFSKYASEVGENRIKVKRPAYVFFGETTVFVDAPFSPMKDIENLDEELGPWAIGKVVNSYTYRLTLTHDQIVNSPDSSLGLVRAVLDAAANRDYELTGEIAFQVDKNTEETQSEDDEPEVKPEIPADPRFAEFTWEEHVRKALSGSTLTHQELAKCLVSIARNIFEPPALLGRDGELASRVIWRFSSGFILWYAAPSDYLILSHEEDELHHDQIWETIGEGDIASADFTWNRDSNGWIYSGELQVWELVSELSLTHDEVAIFLPWDSEFPSQSFDYISDAETMRDAFEIYPEDGEDPRDYEGLFSFFQLLKNETIALPGEIDSIQLAEGKDLMPRYSAFGRFHRMLKDLEKSFQWLVMLDWDPRAENDDDELEDFDPSKTSHIFIGGTIQGVWFTTGRIEYVHDRNNGDILELTEAAERNGLQLIVNGVEDKDSDLVTIVGPGHQSHVRGSDFSTMVSILSEIWSQKEKYPELEEVIGYADLAFPLSDLISRGIVKEKDGAREMIRDGFDLLLDALDIDDVGIISIPDLGLR